MSSLPLYSLPSAPRSGAPQPGGLPEGSRGLSEATPPDPARQIPCTPAGCQRRDAAHPLRRAGEGYVSGVAERLECGAFRRSGAESANGPGPISRGSGTPPGCMGCLGGDPGVSLRSTPGYRLPPPPGVRAPARMSTMRIQGWRSKARVLRGGSWNNNARNTRAANRNRNQPGNRNNNIGVRVVLGVGASTPRGCGTGNGPARSLWPEPHAPRLVRARRRASPDRCPVSAWQAASAPNAAPPGARRVRGGRRRAKAQTVPWELVGGNLERSPGAPLPPPARQ